MVKVTNVREEAAVGPDGRVQTMLRVEFMVGTHGPFVERFAKDGFLAPAMRAKLEEFARQVQALTS